MYLKYIEKDANAEKDGMLEVGNFYKVLSCTNTTLSILDDADEKVEIPMMNMGIVPNGTKARLIKDIGSFEKTGNVGFVSSSIDAIIKAENNPSISYYFTPVDNENECYLCDREDFEIIR